MRLGARRHPRTRRFVAPSEPTIRRTVKSVDADEADVLVGRWLAEQVRAGRLATRGVPTCTTLALDGKTLKGSWAAPGVHARISARDTHVCSTRRSAGGHAGRYGALTLRRPALTSD